MAYIVEGPGLASTVLRCERNKIARREMEITLSSKDRVGTGAYIKLSPESCILHVHRQTEK